MVPQQKLLPALPCPLSTCASFRPSTLWLHVFHLESCTTPHTPNHRHPRREPLHQSYPLNSLWAWVRRAPPRSSRTAGYKWDAWHEACDPQADTGRPKTQPDPADRFFPERAFKSARTGSKVGRIQDRPRRAPFLRSLLSAWRKATKLPARFSPGRAGGRGRATGWGSAVTQPPGQAARPGFPSLAFPRRQPLPAPIERSDSAGPLCVTAGVCVCL